jgi:2-polyprenyl-3-methyl-5-hydroxy-6-metoxy-1,4-benzoquinol methylase
MIEAGAHGCPRCGRASRPAFVAKDYNRRIRAERFPYFRCASCGIFFLDPIPADLAAYYDRYHDIPTKEVLLERAQGEQFKVDILRRFVQSGRLLEVGPSYGAFLAAAQRGGFDASAIEFDAECCRHLERTLGVRAIRADRPEDAVEQLPPYDVLAMWHVVEHLQNPWASLPALVRRLNPGGIVAIATPNPRSLQFRVFGGRWFHLDAPRHLELIPRATLDEFMSGLGLTREFVTTTDEFTLGCNFTGWWVSMTNLLPEKRSKKTWRVFRRLGKISAAIARPFEQLPETGTCYTAVYRKPAAP